MSLKIEQIPCLSDNYGYLVHDEDTGLTASIDTPDGNAIEKRANELGWSLTHIFNTHHHYDHVGGNQYLKDKYGVTIIGPKADEERIPGIDRTVGDCEIFKFGNHDIQVFHTPGHTKGHCAYYIAACDSVFVGDTLFALGCGRLFEGTPAQMFDSLAKLTALPDATQVYCAHEYTLSNGAFALTVDPDNADLQAYMIDARKRRDRDLPTVPTTIAREKLANPFVRAATPNQLGEIRTAKDNF
jgi:hydroxyacylglutathione hydrolase